MATSELQVLDRATLITKEQQKIDSMRTMLQERKRRQQKEISIRSEHSHFTKVNEARKQRLQR